MNPIPNSNPVFSHDVEKFVFQTPDTRMVNPSMLTVKPFKVKATEKSKKTKEENKKKDEDKKKNLLSGFFDHFKSSE